MTKDVLIQKRRFCTRGADAARLLADLSCLPGVSSAEMEPSGQRLCVAYDLEHVGASDIVLRIEAAGAKHPLGLLGRIRLAFIGFTERNARDNALAPVRDCCNKPPSGT